MGNSNIRSSPLDYEDKRYLLIGTVEHFMKYVKEIKPTDKNLPYILEKICWVHEDKSLFDKYKEKLAEFLCEPSTDGMTNAPARSCQTFLEGRLEISKNNKLHKTISDKDHFTLDEFDFSPFSIKNMYRLLT